MTTAEHHLRPFEPEDAARLSLAFAAHDLHKPVETFLRYVDEQQEGGTTTARSSLVRRSRSTTTRRSG